MPKKASTNPPKPTPDAAGKPRPRRDAKAAPKPAATAKPAAKSPSAPGKKTAAKRKAPPKLTELQRREIAALKAKIAEIEGQPLTRLQQRDITWYDRVTADTIVDDYARAVPKGDYCAWAGRQHKQIDDAARNYDLPLDGPTVDLHHAIRALHDLIAANASRLRGAAIEGDREQLEEEKLRQQIAQLQIANDRATIGLESDRGNAIPRQEIASALSVIAAQFRDGGRKIGAISPDALEIFNDLMDSLATEIQTGSLAF